MTTALSASETQAIAAEVIKSIAEGAKSLASGAKHDAAGSPISVGYTHGPGGNLTFPGVDPAVFHTKVGARGIIGRLPVTQSNFMNPTFEVVTGVTADTGSEKTNVCDDGPVAGLMKAGIITSVFGKYTRSTPELDIQRLGQRNDRADPVDLSIVGSGGNDPVFGRGGDIPGDALTNEVSRKMWELDVSLHRLLAVQAWNGNPTNNSAGGGYKEMTGIASLVRTGYVDAESGIALPSLDADIKNFGNLKVDENGTQLVNALTYMWMTRNDLADRTGVSPVNWVFAMRPELFYEVSAIWPCAYLTYRCSVVGNERLNIDATEQVRFRDEMRAGRYLLINGERIPVVLDDGIDFKDGNDSGGNFPAGCFSSDIYLLPLSVLGGARATLYMETFDYDNPSTRSAIASGLLLAQIQGPWLVTPRQKNTCFAFQVEIMPRMILRTPWLAGRLQNVVYCPTQNTRQPFPTDPYYVDGGRTSRQGPSFYQLFAQA